jgi:hypothetical protein
VFAPELVRLRKDPPPPLVSGFFPVQDRHFVLSVRNCVAFKNIMGLTVPIYYQTAPAKFW